MDQISRSQLKEDAMLVLSRRVEEAFRIDGDIRIFIIHCGKGKVRIGIDAPDQVVIEREELWQRRQDFNAESREEELRWKED